MSEIKKFSKETKDFMKERIKATQVEIKLSEEIGTVSDQLADKFKEIKNDEVRATNMCATLCTILGATKNKIEMFGVLKIVEDFKSNQIAGMLSQLGMVMGSKFLVESIDKLKGFDKELRKLAKKTSKKK